uniref:BPTI/Kunitz inhibitor domain-containing protein n=1 Tax=Trichuris muris TaxID=70415 RepID=A0A5S6QT64_TRIMR
MELKFLLLLLLFRWAVAPKPNVPKIGSDEDKSSKAAEICLLQPRAGSGSKYIRRWYYNLTETACKQFVYTGYDGNGNRFRTREACEKVCAIQDVQQKDESPCNLPVDHGPCRASIKRWYYQQRNDICVSFIYGGCGGNSNNFEKKAQCKFQCVKNKGQLAPFEACAQPLATGYCGGKIGRWYFDTKDRKCKYFYYTGCGGNSNRFLTKRDCEEKCFEELKTFGICGQPPDRGPCALNILRWYFNPATRTCEIFRFSGCDGNSNNFVTRRQCERRCLRDISCNQKMEPGPCRNFSQKWYFNHDTKRCERFTYGGCNGTMNRFKNEMACERTCIFTTDLPSAE